MAPHSRLRLRHFSDRYWNRSRLQELHFAYCGWNFWLAGARVRVHHSEATAIWIHRSIRDRAVDRRTIHPRRHQQRQNLAKRSDRRNFDFSVLGSRRGSYDVEVKVRVGKLSRN